MYKKTTTTVEEYFNAPQTPMLPQIAHPMARLMVAPRRKKSVIRLDESLMIKLLKYAKDEAWADDILYEMVETMLELCQFGEVLQVEDYTDIINEDSLFVKSTKPMPEPPVPPEPTPEPPMAECPPPEPTPPV